MVVARECRLECLILLSSVLEFGQFHGISFCFVVVITHLIHHDPIRAFLCTPESAMRLVLRDHLFLKRLAQWTVCRVETHRWDFTGSKLTKRLLAFEVWRPLRLLIVDFFQCHFSWSPFLLQSFFAEFFEQIDPLIIDQNLCFADFRKQFSVAHDYQTIHEVFVQLSEVGVVNDFLLFVQLSNLHIFCTIGVVIGVKLLNISDWEYSLRFCRFDVFLGFIV